MITGDFNMRPSYSSYKAMTNFYTDVNMATAQDSGNTFHGNQGDKHWDALIDYCFVDDGFKPSSYRRITEMVDGLYPSDHYGIQATIEMK